jgi:hypothetical protein
MPPLSSDCSILRWVGHSALPARQKTAVVSGRAIPAGATSVPRRCQDDFWLHGFTGIATWVTEFVGSTALCIDNR